ncbi:hypothetical protein ABIF65_011378 [Bradyrhizobium japonicum]|nr:hypothetical protein [Bradyrhizobium japonicum]MCP1784362.1 hypothetical protein [Bradyrhizobium japonicum]MCP1866324.1 hypothetical protein [Bradyrhizobium japonicum]MCP1898314.1 hypothetical protein [Bradyrhizobium japonicum]MCP1955147.1 hypothetical protein [Bradyrhizobium japonicum]
MPPEVECIGKASAPYEFGVKASTRRRRQITASDGAACMSLEVVVAHEHLIATTARIAQLQDPCMDRAGPGCLDSAPLDLSGFLPGYAERGALRFCRCVGRA